MPDDDYKVHVAHTPYVDPSLITTLRPFLKLFAKKRNRLRSM